MKKSMYSIIMVISVFVGLNMFILHAQEPESSPLSSKTQVCVGCHTRFTPGIVEDWQTSRHASTAPAQALEKSPLERRVSAENVPEELSQYAVGCYECHGLDPENHKDNFNHMGTEVNVIVTPNDCKTCHPAEVEQYAGSKKAFAHKNLLENPVYHALVDSTIGLKTVEAGKTTVQPPSQQTLNDVCLGCHGTKVEVDGTKKVKTKMGKMTLPNLKNWPNQGVGRINPDGSRGSCTSCHARHGFSIEDARKPYTCAQCHGEPDVPAWPVYKVSKHGNIFLARHQKWRFDSVPWVVGKDFKTPTCATCHNSLITSPDGTVVAERTHDFGSRLYLRIFGLIYSHPQPISGDTTRIRNMDDLPLPTTFQGKIALQYLIDDTEQGNRLDTLKKVCTSCHAMSWTEQHFERFENTVAETDKMVLAATQLMGDAWANNLADNGNPFDEALEQMWVKQWLFYANTVRYASAMTGAHKYTAFKDGWWEFTNNLQEIKDRISSHK